MSTTFNPGGSVTITASSFSADAITAKTSGGNLSLAGNGIGNVLITNTTDASSSVTGSCQIAGGTGIAKSLFVGTTINAGTAVNISAATNQLTLGTTHTITLTAPAPAASVTYTIPDAGASTSFLLSAGAQTVTGAKTFSAQPNLTAATNQLAIQANGSGNSIIITASNPATSSRTLTLPDPGANDSFAYLGLAQTFSGIKTFSAQPNLTAASNQLAIQANGSGNSIIITASNPATSSRTLTLPDPGANDSFAYLGLAQTFSGIKTFSAQPNLTTASNQLKFQPGGAGNTTTINATQPATSTVVTIPDPGATTANVVLDQGNVTLNGTLTTRSITGAFTGNLSVTNSTASNVQYLNGLSGLLNWQTITTGAAFGTRNGAAVYAYAGKMWIAGGFNGTIIINTVYNSTDGLTWNAVTQTGAFVAVYEVGYCVFAGKMWIMGGQNASVYTANVYSTTDGANWTLVTSSPGWTARRRFTTLVYGGKMWVIGGDAGAAFYQDVWSSPDGATWTQVATSTALSSTRTSYAACIFQSKMWVFGGNNAGGLANDSYYSTDGITWTQANASCAWAARQLFRAVNYNGSIYILGGYENGAVIVNDVWVSQDGINFTSVSQITTYAAFFDGSIVDYNGYLYIVSGNNSAQNPTASVYGSLAEVPKTLYVDSIQTYTSNGNLTLTSNGTGHATLPNGAQYGTSGGTPATYNYYEEFTGSLTLSGPWAANQSVNIAIVRSGKNVTFSTTSIVSATSNSSTLITSTAVPSRFLPSTANNVYFVIWVTNSSQAAGTAILNSSTGVMSFYAGGQGVNFSSGVTVGFNVFSISWTIS